MLGYFHWFSSSAPLDVSKLCIPLTLLNTLRNRLRTKQHALEHTKVKSLKHIFTLG